MDKTRLREAIAEFDRTAPARDAMLLRAETTEDVSVWEAAEASALVPVQDAFFELTSEFNSRKKCSLLSIEDARAFAEGRASGRYHSTPIEHRI